MHVVVVEDQALRLFLLFLLVQKGQERSKNNTLTRDKDYTLQEFSDPVYLVSYTEDLRQKWKKLL